MCDQSVVNQAAVPISPILFEANAEAPISMPSFSAGAISSHANGKGPSTAQCAIPAIGSSLLDSAGPIKKCEAKAVVNDFQIPSLAEFNRSHGVQSPPVDCNDQPLHDDGNHVMEDASSFRGLSPLVPIRLSQLFQNAQGDVECSQYVVQRYLNSFESPNDELTHQGVLLSTSVPHQFLRSLQMFA